MTPAQWTRVPGVNVGIVTKLFDITSGFQLDESGASFADAVFLNSIADSARQENCFAVEVFVRGLEPESSAAGCRLIRFPENFRDP